MVWNFSQNNQGTDKATADLTFQVPETDNSQVYATCGGDVPAGSVEFMIAADIGSSKPTDSARLRFSGGGKEYEFDGKIAIPASGEGIVGARVTIPNDHPIWPAFGGSDMMSYQIPGFAASNLKLAGGQSAIQQFNDACVAIASPDSAPKVANSTGGGISEKEAFNAAKDLNSPEAWRAFLKVYPKGFYAEVAKNYLDKQNSNSNATAKPAEQKPEPETPKLAYFQSAEGQTPWFNFQLSQDEGNASSFAAGVKAAGLELVTYCTQDRQMRLRIVASGDGYPKFTERMEQGLKADSQVAFNFGEKGIRQVAMAVEGLTGDASSIGDLGPGSATIAALMSANSLQMDAPPFGANFQLKGSRKAICSVMNKCGAKVAACQPKPKPKVVRTAPRDFDDDEPRRARKPSAQCRSRSVFVEGRGCVLRSSLDRRKPKKVRRNRSGCRGGRIRFEGQCLFRSELRGYCGPGFTPRGSRCVSNAQVRRTPKKRKPSGVILKRNEGGTISLAQCLRNGMTPEFGYCVEDD